MPDYPSVKTVQAQRFVRRLSGGSQAHLLRADDGCFYAVKFRNNPQHRRILINELIASVFLRHLQILSPETALVQVSPEFLAENPEVHLTVKLQGVEVEAGLHFGSQYPCDPSEFAIYDFLPDELFEQVLNPWDFRGALV